MGEDIATSGFTPADFERFSQALATETQILRDLFALGGLSESPPTIGFEVECWILDHNYFPAPINQGVLSALNHPLVVPELSRFNLELNCEPLRLSVGALDAAEKALGDLWAYCNETAHRLDANMVMIGTLPTIRDADMSLANISPLNRYHALNREVLRQRGGAALNVDILGRDHLVSSHRDVMLEAATTSFQIHLKPPASKAHLYYNASIAASGPILAACGNAPLLFGKSLWDETRIPLFEQAVVTPGRARVTMGAGYAASCLDLFEENIRDYPPLLPIHYDEPPERLRHLRLHNGVIWRWNRPLVGFDADGTPHLRIEHRILPSGPTIADMIANTALYLGLARDLAEGGDAGHGGLAFADALTNFYAAARHGLAAELVWPGLGALPAGRLLCDHLLPRARAGLAAFGVDGDAWLDLVEARIASGQTGAVWQRHAHAACGGDLFQLMAAYCERQRSGAPVHQWEAMI